MQKLFYSIPEIVEMTGLSNSTLWRMEQRHEFPRRKRISPGRSGYDPEEIERWRQNVA